jgi:hypothetical protein
MEQVMQLLLGSWTGQLTLLIVTFMLSMMGYLSHLFLKKSDPGKSKE